ncbi:MAG: adenylate kinase [Actinomycetota bacterium]|jgi:adenylate kinase|nr:adenylate kinase [Actinomycetota bacterium]MEE2646418.1 adenylate kinase [Actinomycetota bacterium]|tara:strand:- start:3385 stop:3987 length:603 start_codon:yes stop_codon:yes gene_type:complete
MATNEAMKPVNLVIFGRQGSGKGTQCAMIITELGSIHISTGDMLRAAVEQGTEFGLQAKAIMDRGELVSDEVISGIVAERLAQSDVTQNGFLLDGYPRTLTQAESFVGILNDLGLTLDLALNLDVPIDEVTTRMLSRGRADDTEEAIARRLDLYEKETAPLFEFFLDQGVFEVIDGLGSESEVFDRLNTVISAVISGKSQ